MGADETPASGNRRGGDRRQDDRRTTGSQATRGGGASGASGEQSEWLSFNGWSVLAHPMLLDQIERLIAASVREHATLEHPETGPNTKLLGHLADLVCTAIPRDPGAKEFRHGGTLVGRSHWFRAKTGNGRFRLFYRFDSRMRTIILVWVNDEDSLRTYGSKTDAYKVFAQMLDDGNPPDSWEALKTAASEAKQVKRLAGWVKADQASSTPPGRAAANREAAETPTKRKPRR